jgi:hypothetical protein
MFKDVVTALPYSHGLDLKGWRGIKPRHVPIRELIATKDALLVVAIAPTARGLHDDPVIHVVKHEGALYLEDGHHRTAREALAGADWVLARVLDLDRPAPAPVDAHVPVHVREECDVPGLVWVEGKGYRSAHLARALEVGGQSVDWHRWTPGTEELHKPLPYRDVV